MGHDGRLDLLVGDYNTETVKIRGPLNDEEKALKAKLGKERDKIYAELEKLKTQPVPDDELQKVKNQNAAAEFRRLQSSFGLLLQLLIAEGYRGWETINTTGPELQAVSAEDIRRVANTYFCLLYTSPSPRD